MLPFTTMLRLGCISMQVSYVVVHLLDRVGPTNREANTGDG